MVFYTIGIQAQNSFYDKLQGYDLSQVIHPDSIADDMFDKFKRPEPLGFIGDNYQRFQIHFTSFQKSEKNLHEYVITGKTRVKSNICSFTGTLKIVSAKYDNDPEMLDITGFKSGIITSNIEIIEDKSQKGSGSIKGTLVTDVVFDDKRQLHYNAIMLIADGYSNNSFIGTWTSYRTGVEPESFR